MKFVDASFFLEFLLPDQEKTNQAILTMWNLKTTDLVTSWAIIGEVLTVSSQRVGHRASLDFLQSVQESGMNIIVEENNLIKQTKSIFQNCRNKNVSWVDCYSVAIMRHLGISEILTFDRHFKKLLAN